MIEKEWAVIEAMKIIKEYCKNGCSECIFKNLCNEDLPRYWAKKQQRKTRKDTLLEKYPDAQIRPDGIPEVCAAHLGLVAACEGQTMDDCVECWMHEEDKK